MSVAMSPLGAEASFTVPEVTQHISKSNAAIPLKRPLYTGCTARAELFIHEIGDLLKSAQWGKDRAGGGGGGYGGKNRDREWY